MSLTERVFLDYSVKKLEQYSSRIQDCLGRLTDDEVWARSSTSENAVGNLVLHLCGNVRQWIGAGVGGFPDIRQRDGEFSAHGGVLNAELADRLSIVVREATAIIGGLGDSRLMEMITVQGYHLTVFEAVYHVVEHFSHHTGQIVFATKLFTSGDLGYYQHLTGSGAHSEKAP